MCAIEPESGPRPTLSSYPRSQFFVGDAELRLFGLIESATKARFIAADDAIESCVATKMHVRLRFYIGGFAGLLNRFIQIEVMAGLTFARRRILRV